mgnify:CR=1 FL=1|jgi:hypothetical protein
MKGYSNKERKWVDINTASNTPIADLSNSYDSNNVEGALQEAAAKDLLLQNKLDEHAQKIEDLDESVEWLKKYGGGGSGGGGGGGGSASCYISSSLAENLMVNTGDNLDIDIDFSSPNIGAGTIKVSLDDVEVYSGRVRQGKTVTTITSDKFKKGTNKLSVYVVDRVGNMSNTLVFYVRYGGLEIESLFDSSSAYDAGSSVRFYFIPSSVDTSLPLTFYMEVDGTRDKISCVSDVRTSYTFPASLSEGTHKCRAWISDGKTNSKVYEFNLVLLGDSNIAISTNTKNMTIEEGNQITLDYKVFKRNATLFNIKVYIDDKLVTTGTCNLETQYYKNSTLDEGTHHIKIEALDITNTVSDSITWIITVTASAYELIQPTTSGLLFSATARNRNNTDENREIWQGVDQDGNKIDTILNNFTFNSENGWIDDALVISGDSGVEIPISPLSENAKYGFSLDIEFVTKSIGIENSEVLSIWDDTKNVGIKITLEEAIIKSTENEKRLYFSENENMSIMFVIDRNEKTAKILLNGVVSGGFALGDYVADGVPHLEDFTTDSHVYLGGKNTNGYCEIKNIRIYSLALSTNEQMNNYLSNITDKSKQKELSKFQKGDTLPTLTVTGDFAGLGKNDKKPCDIVYQPVDVTTQGEAFRLEGKYSMLQYQGTSSMQYPIKNYRLNPRNEKGKVKLDPFHNGTKESRFTLKADQASSGHWQNTGLAKWVNDKLYHYDVNDQKSMNPKKWFDLQNGGKITDTRETINGFPCRLILVNDGTNTLQEGQQEPTPGNTKDMGVFNFNNDKSNTKTLGFDTENFPFCASFEVASNSDTSAGAFMSYKGAGGKEEELKYIKESFELRFPDEDDVGVEYGFLDMNGDATKGLKRVIDFVDKSTDEDFKTHFEEYFNKQYTFRYFLLVMALGMVDNLGKNMMLDTWDGQIFYPRFYDMDTICSFNNSGVITFDTDIEMAQGYWNTSNSRLWTRIRDLFHPELVAIYKDMRQYGLSYDNLMHYFYDEQIALIPEAYYNKDYDVKYAPYANQYMGMANGSSYEHLKRWLKRRLLFTDTLYDYVPSYADSITIRANTTKEMRIEIETYAPVYQHMSWYNNQMDKKKIDGKTAVVFTGKAQAATDQEVLIYGGSNIKRIRGLATMNPDSMIIGNASKLIELDCAGSPILTDINQSKANLSPNIYLTKVDISNCPLLGGTLRLNNSPLLSEVNAQGTAITGMLLPTSIKNLAKLKVPKGVTELTLNDAKTLVELDLEKGYLLETLSLSNCNKLKSFDLSKVKNISLDNSYNAEEIRLSTNEQVNLKNMLTLKRLVYTPNKESEDFNLTALKNSPNVTVTTFNCPKLKDFITTAPQRISYGKSDDNIYPYKLFMANKLDLSGTQLETVKFLCTTDVFDLKLPKTVKNFYCDSAFDLDTKKITDGAYDIIHSNFIQPYTEEYNENIYLPKATTITCKSTTDYTGIWTKRYAVNGGEVVTGRDEWLSIIRSTDYLLTIPNTSIYLKTSSANEYGVCIMFFNKDKKYIGYINNSTDKKSVAEGTTPNDCQYVIFSVPTVAGVSAEDQPDIIIKYTALQTPNIVPTSANGSLLFNINQNTLKNNSPYIWDLQGMKLSDFHTYGVNNKVEIPSNSFLTKIDSSKLYKIPKYKYWYYENFCSGLGEEHFNSISPIDLGSELSISVSTDGTTEMLVHGASELNGRAIRPTAVGTVNLSARYIGISYPMDATYVKISTSDNNYLIMVNEIINNTESSGITKKVKTLEEVSDYTTLGDLKSVTMPKRLADYKVQIKNADITPNQYNTMLYPKLVDTTLPITGKLDYSKYKGKYLSWAFAYTTNDVVKTPLDSRKQGQIINDYNKLYGTSYIDIIDVWAYKDDDFTNRAINNNITKAYIELTQTNYKSRIDEVLQWYPNCVEVYLFEDGSVTSLTHMIGMEGSNNGNPNARMQVKIIRFMEGYFKNVTSVYSMCNGNKILEEIYNIPNSITDMGRCFNGCVKLTHISNFPSSMREAFNLIANCNIIKKVPEIPNTVTNLEGAYVNCYALNQQIDLSNCINISNNGLRYTWQNCASLTYTPILPTNHAGSLASAFSGTKITTAPVLPNGVTNLTSAFKDCKELTTVGNIPTSCTNYDSWVSGCRKLTSVPETGYKGGCASAFYNCKSLNQKIDLSLATNSISGAFFSCESLTIPPILPIKLGGDYAKMEDTFSYCTKLGTPPKTPEGVLSMAGCYYGCTSLITAPYIPNTCTNIKNLACSCNKLTEITIPLENLKIYTNALNGTGIQNVNWVGKRKTDFNIYVNGLGGGLVSTKEYKPETLKSLVDDHLEDLYKDEIKINYGSKIMINNTETTITT